MDCAVDSCTCGIQKAAAAARKELLCDMLVNSVCSQVLSAAPNMVGLQMVWGRRGLEEM